MADETTPEEQEANFPTDAAEEAAANADAAAAAEAESEMADETEDDDDAPDDGALEDGSPTYEELLDKNADLNDKLLRALAEMENVRRRAEKTREDAANYAIASFARDMLNVSDNMGRAIATVSEANEAENAVSAEDIMKNLIEGIEMTAREMHNIFERVGIRLIEAEGARFDHNFHEAMFEIEDLEKTAGTVMQVIQPGYVLKDRLLRPAKVGVSKGGPKAAAPAASTADDASGTAQANAYGNPRNGPGGQLDEEL